MQVIDIEYEAVIATVGLEEAHESNALGWVKFEGDDRVGEEPRTLAGRDLDAEEEPIEHLRCLTSAQLRALGAHVGRVVTIRLIIEATDPHGGA